MSTSVFMLLRRQGIAMPGGLLLRHRHVHHLTAVTQGSPHLAVHGGPRQGFSTRTAPHLQPSPHSPHLSSTEPRDSVHADAPSHSPFPSSQNLLSDAPVNVASIVRQLQALALCRSPLTRKAPKTEWSVSADALADLMEAGAADTTDMHDVDSAAAAAIGGVGGIGETDKEERNASQPAWKVGLGLANDCASSREVAEWLLLLCLRSRDAPSGSAAPLEVCDGVYHAWRGAVREASTRRESAADGHAEGNEGQVPSPFYAKGLHHRYAQWLLQDYHAAQQALQEMYGAATHEVIGVGVDAAGEFDVAAAVHHAYEVLERVLTVLLLDLPEDEAVLRREKPPSPLRRGAPRVSPLPALRPSTALLVLEASRQLALLVNRAAVEQGGSTDQTPGMMAAFPLLSFLTTVPSTSAEQGQRDLRRQRGVMSRPLVGVARVAFEQVLGTGSASRPSVHSEAAVQYLGFLMATHAHRTEEPVMAEIESFVCRGSRTACRVAGQPETVAEADDAVLLSDRLCASGAAAAAVREVFSVYVNAREERRGDGKGFGGAGRQMTPGDKAADPSVVEARAQEAFAKLLLAPTPASLWPLFALRGGHAVTGAPQFSTAGGGEDGEEHDDGAPRRRPVSWCAWMLRVLLCDLERVGHAPAAAVDAWQLEEHHSSSQTVAAVKERREVWQRQSEWTIRVTAHLMTLLRHTASASLQQQQERHGHVQFQSRKATEAARRPVQEVWRLVFQAALQGCFFHTPTGHHSLLPTHARGRHTSKSDAPPLLRELCYPHYDKSQWRGASVNLYVRLLDQWGQGEHVRNVFATVSRWERDSQSEVQAAVLAERQQQQQQQPHDSTAAATEPAREGKLEREPTADSSTELTPLDRVCRRYHPALLLHSCLCTLKYCGCPARVVGLLRDGGVAMSGEDVEEEEGGEGKMFTSAAQARLAGEVLQYMLCALHVVEHKAMQHALRSNGKKMGIEGGVHNSDYDDDADGVTITLSTEGHSFAQWVKWVGQCGVPAVAELYHRAGLEEEWAAQGF